MKPLVVTMEAFGPYPGVQALDFAELRGAGFFLITGPTGSGKTTILDAMAFALYGETSSGPESDGGRTGAAMRSDHADPQTLTRVMFDFSLGDDLYRVERVPEQERPKLRGEGTTAHGQEATMWRLRRDGAGALEIDGAPLASGWTRVRSKAEDLLGFRAEQFRQVVMLPQGRFQQFLEADSSRREAILRALFDTRHYSDIEQALKDEAAALRRAAETVTTQRDEVLRQAEAADEDELAERRDRFKLGADEASSHAEQAEAEREVARQALAAGQEAHQALSKLADAKDKVARLASRDDDIAGQRAELEAARRAAEVNDVAREAAEAKDKLEQARSKAAEEEKKAATAKDELAAVQAALEVETSRAPAREHAADEVRRLTAFSNDAAALAEAREELDQAVTDFKRERGTAEAADGDWQAACERLVDLEAVWRKAQAGLLAAGLSDGEACPVCGSVHHPSPAHLGDAAPSEDELEAARAKERATLEKRDAARTALQAAQATHAAAAACVDERRAGLPDELTAPGALDAALQAARRLSDELRDAFERAQREVTTAAIAASSSEAAATAAASALEQAGSRAKKCAERLTRRLEQAGFAAEADRLAAARAPATVEALSAAVAEHEQAVLRAGEGLRLAQAAADGVEPPDLEALESAATEAASVARTAREEAVRLADAVETAEKQLARLESLAGERAEVAARYESVGRLADVANRRNPRNLSFQSYVLGAFLDDVLVAASQRLRLMSKNRYSLERTEERSGRRQAAGLDLVSYDAWTGVPRPVATLSGGEKFMAALSLALGLAEVVQAHAGGIRLETVFVDEGFGSLDDESLDLAVGALMSLGDGGRLVGIISHVSELRERIDARLEVSAGKRGSTARFVVP